MLITGSNNACWLKALQLALSPVHTSNNVEATDNFVACCFDIVAVFGNNVASFDNHVASFSNSCRTKFRPFDKWKQIVQFVSTCRKNEISFDIVAETGNIAAKRQQCRSNIQYCRKNRLTCSVRQCCLDIVAGVDGA